MGLCQHRYVFPLFGQLFEFGNQFVNHGVVHVVNGIAERTGYCRVVDVL